MRSVRRLLQGGISFDLLLFLVIVYSVAGSFPSFVEWVPSFFAVVGVYLAVYTVSLPNVLVPLLFTLAITFLACSLSSRFASVSRVILAIGLSFPISGLVMISHTAFLRSVIVLGLIFFRKGPEQIRSSSRRALFVAAFPLLSVPIFILSVSDDMGSSLLTVYNNAGPPAQFYSVAVDSRGNIYTSLKRESRVVLIRPDSDLARDLQSPLSDFQRVVQKTSLRDKAGPIDLTNYVPHPERFAIAADKTVYVANRGAGLGVYALSPDSPSPPKRVLSTGAIDLIADHRNHRILAIGELNRELAIYDTEEQTETYLQLPANESSVFAISNGLESGEYFLSMGFHGTSLLRLRMDYLTNAFEIDRLPMGFFSFGLFYHERSGLLYVSRPLIGLVDVIDVRRFERTKRIPAPMLVRQLAVSSDGKLLFAASYLHGTLWVIRTDSGQRCAAYAAAEHPRMIEYSSFYNAIFVAVEDRLLALRVDALPPECFAGAADSEPAAVAASLGYENPAMP